MPLASRNRIMEGSSLGWERTCVCHSGQCWWCQRSFFSLRRLNSLQESGGSLGGIFSLLFFSESDEKLSYRRRIIKSVHSLWKHEVTTRAEEKVTSYLRAHMYKPCCLDWIRGLEPHVEFTEIRVLSSELGHNTGSKTATGSNTVLPPDQFL